ncbi:MAG: pyruvate kinase alpha/beta domain-containing protein, partial [Nitrososphaeria archaeon]
MNHLGQSRPTFYFDVHGEINTDKTVELAVKRAEELGIRKTVVASETGLTALKALDAFPEGEVIVVSSAAGTYVEGSVIGDLRIGIPDEAMLQELTKRGAKVVRGTDPFWNLAAHTTLIDACKLGMMYLKVICGGIHVCISAVLEATDVGHLIEGEEVVALAGSFVGLDTAIVAGAANSVNFF